MQEDDALQDLASISGDDNPRTFSTVLVDVLWFKPAGLMLR